MDITLFDTLRKAWIKVPCSAKFEMHGETFVAHKVLETPDGKVRWTVSHKDTGLSVLHQGYKCRALPTTRAAAVALAKTNLEHRTLEAVKAAVNRGQETLEELVAEFGGPQA
jgi:hypothetical protein